MEEKFPPFFGDILGKGNLYIVPTPVGNLKDITYRAIEVLEKVDFIAAEDTRTSKILLNHYNISTKMLSYHKFNEKKRAAELIKILENGKNIAVISDAGTPGISDPSQIIINEAINNQIRIIPLPGATAFVPALIGSGLNNGNFMFIGFLPDKLKAKNILFEKIKSVKANLIFYESPHRIFSTLKLFLDTFGNRKAAIGREISKIYESFYRGKLAELLEENIMEKGEFVIVLEGFQEEIVSDEKIAVELLKMFDEGIKQSRAVKLLAQKYLLPKNKIYDLAIKLKNSPKYLFK